MSHLRRSPVPTRDLKLEEPPNRWQLFVTWLFDSLTPAVPVVSTMGASSLKSASIWRGVVFVALVVGMMAMGRSAWAFSCSDVTEISKAQCETLVALYDSTDGDNWKNNTGWQQTNTPCSWFGVTCENSKITEIDLNDNNLSGTLPSLSALTSLETLALHSLKPEETVTPNKLTGNIPDLSALTNLQILSLRRNEFSGTVPDLSSLTQLTYLNLSVNQLTGNFPDLANLTNLQWVWIGSNQLTGTFPDLTGLTNLKSIGIADNQLTGTIPDLSQFTALEQIWVQKNQFTGNIPDLSALTNLQSIGFYRNQFTGSIPDLSNLTKLRWAHLHTNQLTGNIPDLTALTQLRELGIGNNQIDGTIPDLSTLTNLEGFWVGNNQLTGAIPNLNTLTSLTSLGLTGNQLCQNTSANYGNWTEVNEYPVCGNPNITLTSPVHGTTSIPISGQVFTWEPVAGAKYNRIVISTQANFAGFTDTVSSGYCNDTTTCLTAANTGMQSYTALGLSENTTYYWKVRASKNPTFWSEVHSFTTGAAPKTGCNGDTQLPDNLCNGLTLYMPMNGNANDASGNGSDGVVNGATLTTDRHGNANSAYEFDGESNYISVADSQQVDFVRTQDFAIMVWLQVAAEQSSNGVSVIEKWSGGTVGYPYVVRYHTAASQWPNRTGINRHDGTNSASMATNALLNDEQIHHLAYVKTGDTLLLYVDGKLVSQRKDTITGETTNSSPLFLGRRGGDINPDYFKGVIDDLFIYNRGLSASEIQAYYDSNKPAEPQLVAHYCFDDPNNLGKNCSNADVYPGFPTNGVSSTEGKIGNAASLDGEDDWFNVSGINADFMENAFTITAWFKPDVVKSKQVVIWFQDDQPSIRMGDQDIYFGYKQNDSQPPNTLKWSRPGSHQVNIGEWNCAAYTYEASDNYTMRHFLNGENIGQRKLDGNFLTRETPRVRIGVDDGTGLGRYFNGLIDDVRIYNYALSDEDIQSLCPTPPVSEVVLEDAEDGDTDGWTIYSKQSDDAAFSNVFDSDINSQVIEFTGESNLDAFYSGYHFPAGGSWDNTTNFIAQWKMKTAMPEGRHTFYWGVKTNSNIEYVTYSNHDLESVGCYRHLKYVICNLDGNVNDGNWHTITRDLEADLKLVEPDIELQAVNYLKIRTAGRVDDIKLLNHDAIDTPLASSTVTINNPIMDNGYLLEDAEDSTLQGWWVYSPKEGGAVLVNVFDSDKNSRVIEFRGDSFSGYQLSKPEGGSLSNSTDFFAQWDMRFTTDDRSANVYWQVKTTGAINYITYLNDGLSGCRLGSGNYVLCSLENTITDDKWHTITRNLVADLHAVKPELELQEVEEFKIRMAGQIDDIKLLDAMPATDCNAVTEIPTAQCETLLALYDNTGGDNWTNNDGWKKGNTPCNWYSIECTDGNITKISLEDNNLSGTIPDLSTLTKLEGFWVGNNKLTGAIPNLNTLTSLTSLILTGNQLCQNTSADYGNWTEVNEYPVCGAGKYTAYGTIRDELGNKLAGVEVQVAGKTVTTDVAGNWEIPKLPEGEYTVTVSKDGYTFAPKTVALGNNEFRQETVFKPLSNLKVKVVAEPRTVEQNDNVTYIATIINGGAETATGIVLTNVLAENAGGLISIEALDGGECDTDTVTCTLPDLTTGNSARVKLVVSNTQANSLLNTATVTANEYQADVQKTRTRVIPYLAASITDSPEPLQLPLPGEERVLHYDVAATLSANAPTKATGVNLVMTLPKGVELQAINSDFGMCDTSELPVITCSMTDLSVASADDISHVTVGIDVVLKDAGLLALTLEAKVSANEYPVHTDKERTKIFIDPKYKVDIAFVIDDSGSMQGEINQVKAALNKAIDEIDSSKAPLSVLLTFGDQVKYRAVTQDLTVLRDAIGKLKATGGGTCPEASYEAISFAIPHVKEGGTILFATDASPYEGSDVDGMISRLNSNGIRFNAMVFGDCADENSWNQ